jgi:hypothetical protein
MTGRWRIASLCVLGLLALGASTPAASDRAATGRAAPDFPRADAAGWINSEPLTMRDLRGQVVVLDIWTFG